MGVLLSASDHWDSAARTAAWIAALFVALAVLELRDGELIGCLMCLIPAVLLGAVYAYCAHRRDGSAVGEREP